jgi:hypothetical protein
VRDRLTQRLAELSTTIDRFLDLIDDPDWPVDKLKARMAEIRNERDKIDIELAELRQTSRSSGTSSGLC